jgi:protease-4
LSSQMTPRKVALGLLIVSALALLVGLFNAARLAQEAAQSKAANEDSTSVASILNKRPHLAEINLSGMITMDESSESGLFHSESNAVMSRKALDEAAKDDSVKGVLLHINTPGGTVGMSQELNAAVQRVSKKKPVVVSMGDLTASGGYYTACAADKIIANPGTLTASIGVIISTINFSDLMKDKLGVEAVTIKSGKFKDILSPYRKPTPEDKALVQRLIDSSYQDFLNTVIQGRTRFMTDPQEKADRIAKIKAVADGRVVSGTEGVASGLVDELGDFEHAYNVLDQMAKEKFKLRGKERLPLETMEGRFSLMDFLGMNAKVFAPIKAPADMAAQMVPLSLRYPNQPLWVME